MENQRSSNLFAALVAAGLLLLAAWGNAVALFMAAAATLVLGGTFFRPRDSRVAVLAMLFGAIVAAVVVFILARRH